MKPTDRSINIDNSGYKTVVVPEASLDALKQKLGDDFVWGYDEKSNQLYLMEKAKADASFTAETGKDCPAIAHKWYNGELVNKWDD